MSETSLKAKIQKNERRITFLEEKLKASQNENSSLKEEIQKLKDENEILREEQQRMKKENAESKVRIDKLEKENESRKAQDEHDEYIFIIAEIGAKLERNMCELVLGKEFNKKRFYKFKDIDNYIIEIEDSTYQASAKKRLGELKGKIQWNRDLVYNLKKQFGEKRIKMAHPELSSEKIQQARDFLREKEELDDEDVNNINKLAEQWKKSVDLLQ